MKMMHKHVHAELDRLAGIREKRQAAVVSATTDRHVHAHRLKQLDIRIAMLKRHLKHK
jgi:hypothetical protein